MRNIKTTVLSTSGLLALMLAGQSQAALIATGSQTFMDNGGVTTSLSGVVHAEVFDAAGGVSSYTGDIVAATTGDYTFVFHVALDPAQGEGVLGLSAFSFNTYELGTGDIRSFTDPAVSGGVYGGGAIFSSDTLSASYAFTDFAEGTSSAALWFTSPFLDLTSTGSTIIETGDRLTFGGTLANGAGSLDGQLSLTAVPVPAAVWLLGSGLIGLAGFARRKKA